MANEIKPEEKSALAGKSVIISRWTFSNLDMEKVATQIRNDLGVEVWCHVVSCGFTHPEAANFWPSKGLVDLHAYFRYLAVEFDHNLSYRLQNPSLRAKS